MTPELQSVIDKILAYPNVPAIAGKWPSRSMWATDGAGVDDSVGMILNTDGNVWNVELILGYLIGAQSDVAIVNNTAAGVFPPGSYVAGNPWLQARATDFAKALVASRAQLVAALGVTTPPATPATPNSLVTPVASRNPFKVAPMTYLHTISTVVGGATAVGSWILAQNVVSPTVATAISGAVVGLTGLFNFLVKEEGTEG